MKKPIIFLENIGHVAISSHKLGVSTTVFQKYYGQQSLTCYIIFIDKREQRVTPQIPAVPQGKSQACHLAFAGALKKVALLYIAEG